MLNVAYALLCMMNCLIIISFEKLVSKEYGEIKSVGKSTYRKNRLTGEKEYVAHNTVGWHTKLK